MSVVRLKESRHTWNVYVHWYNAVTASDHSVGIVVVATTIGAAETV